MIIKLTEVYNSSLTPVRINTDKIISIRQRDAGKASQQISGKDVLTSIDVGTMYSIYVVETPEEIDALISQQNEILFDEWKLNNTI